MVDIQLNFTLTSNNTLLTNTELQYVIFKRLVIINYITKRTLHTLKYGRLPFDQKFRNFRNGDKWYGNFLGKVPENPEIVELSEKRTMQLKIPEIPG